MATVNFAQSSFVYFNYPLQEAIRRLHQHGYQGVEIWGGRPHAYRHDLDDELTAIRSLLDSLGMAVPNFIPAQFRYPTCLCTTRESVRQDSVAYIKDSIDTALRLGAVSVSLCAGMTLVGEDLDRSRQQLRRSVVELLDFTEKSGMLLLIEPAHPAESRLVQTIADGLRLIREIGSPRLGVLLDTGHCHVNGEDLAAAVRSLRGVPLHVHIDDNNGDGDAHNTPGAGTIDFAPFAAALCEIGYRGFVSAELGFQYTMNPDAAVEKTYTALDRIFSAT
jgi:fructoselysine 3-epimerase